MLEVNRLTRRYGNTKAVDDVSFTIGKGEIVGLLGHNGAGKTTIMKMLSGYLEANQGHILINGQDLSSVPKQVQQELGYLPENLPIYQEMTVADYLDYAAELKGLKGEAKHREIKRTVEATDIGARLLDTIATLSRGYKQRVGVAQAILGNPKLLILDEPTNGLDPTQTEHMRQLIRDIAREATVILSTHIMQEVDALCDRVLILRGGQLVVDAKLQELCNSNHLQLTTSMEPAAAKPLLEQTAEVADLQPVDSTESSESGRYAYRVRLHDQQSPLTAGASLAKAVVEKGYDLYRLAPEHRDLETLFREVSEAPAGADQEQEVDHAA